MLIAFMDEFGHIGPFAGRQDPKHNTSPVFGIGGIVLPANEVRNFSVWFYKQKCLRFAKEIESSPQASLDVGEEGLVHLHAPKDRLG